MTKREEGKEKKNEKKKAKQILTTRLDGEMSTFPEINGINQTCFLDQICQL